MDTKIVGLIGFAAKCRKLLLGTHSVEQGIRQKKVKLVLAAADVNPKRIEIIRLWCKDMEIPFLVTGTKSEYGTALRKAPLGLLALTDEQMASGIIRTAQRSTG